MSHNQSRSNNGPGCSGVGGLNDFEEHWGRKESRCSEKSAVAVGCSIAVQRDVLGPTPKLQSLVCVFTCWSLCTYLKPAALGTLGFIFSSCVISMPAFQTVHQSDMVHKPASASLKRPSSQNSSGPLYLTDA